MRDPYQSSSYFSLELYWIGWLLWKTNHALLLLISLILVIFVLELLSPCTLPMCQGVPFFYINKTYYLSKKKKKTLNHPSIKQLQMNSNSPITLHGLLFNVHSLGKTSQIVGFLLCFSRSSIILFSLFFDKYYSFFPLKTL